MDRDVQLYALDYQVVASNMTDEEKEERKRLTNEYIQTEYRHPDYTSREKSGFRIAWLCLGAAIIISLIIILF